MCSADAAVKSVLTCTSVWGSGPLCCRAQCVGRVLLLHGLDPPRHMLDGEWSYEDWRDVHLDKWVAKCKCAVAAVPCMCVWWWCVGISCCWINQTGTLMGSCQHTSQITLS